jgi:hypothetical protein
MALLLAKRRRTGSDDAFNNLVTGHAPGYVQVGGVLQRSTGATGTRLMSSTEPDPAADPPPPPVDPAFQNFLVEPGELHPEIQAFVADLANTAARRWRERGAGMWEMRRRDDRV